MLGRIQPFLRQSTIVVNHPPMLCARRHLALAALTAPAPNQRRRSTPTSPWWFTLPCPPFPITKEYAKMPQKGVRLVKMGALQ